MIIFRVTTGRSWLRHPEARTSTNTDVQGGMTNIAFTRERETGISDTGSRSFDKVESPQGEKVLNIEDPRLGPVIDVRRREPAETSVSSV
jgi:hypothetical protein